MTRFTSIVRTAAVLVLAVAPLAAQAAIPYEVVTTGRDGFIHKYDEAGNEILSFKTNFSATVGDTTGADSVWGIAVDQPNYQIWVTRFAAGGLGSKVYRVAADGTVLGSVTLSDGVNPSPTYTRSIDVGSDGNADVVTDDNSGQIWKFNTTTFAVSLLAGGVVGSPHDVVQASDNTLYVTKWTGSNIQTYDSTSGALTGTAVPFGDFDTPPQVDRPYAVEFAPDGNLYVVDGDQYSSNSSQSNDYLLRRFDLSPSLSTVGTDTVVDDGAATSRIHFGLAVGPDGRSFIPSYNPLSDFGSIVQVSAGGVASTFVSDGSLHVHADVLLVPEPASLVLLALGGLLVVRRRVA